MLDKARGLKSDQLFMDLEDAVAPLAKADARKNIVQALNEGGYEDKIRAVRVNDWTTQWTYTDVIEIVEGAGANLDCIMLPKVQTADQIVALLNWSALTALKLVALVSRLRSKTQWA